jgi:hypothetical protein
MATRLFLGVLEELSNVLFGSTDIFTKNFGPIHHFGLSGIQHFPNLTGNESFTRSRGSV